MAKEDLILLSYYQNDSARVNLAARASAMQSVQQMEASKSIPKDWHQARGRFLQSVNYIKDGPWGDRRN
ncbi:hypothetical protein D0962_34910 [Leptolyngbyaceae cyanobacterium CCMR0082]|uniref:Uncharacterized protein n=1 Tax=Adonisia turfae CCMR0082 TaxID=2304604 RepID=A0A6M0SHR9_9CYAN|nr:hypothetical protein [Adonisia turfae CCMR0082]